MKTVSIALAFSLIPLALARGDEPAPAPKHQVCLLVGQIDHTTPISDTEILFRMNNGKMWKNTLKRECNGLKFERGYSETIRGGEICSNQQIIYVLQRGTPCQLGEFTPYTPPPKQME